MKSGDGQSSELLSLDYAIAQKLLPTINGVGEGYKEQLNELQYWLSDTKLTKSAGVLEQIISQGESRMDYFGTSNVRLGHPNLGQRLENPVPDLMKVRAASGFS